MNDLSLTNLPEHAQNLGAPIKTFPANQGTLVTLLMFMTLLIAIGISFLALGVAGWSLALSGPNPGTDMVLGFLLFLLGGGILYRVFVLYRYAVGYRGLTVALCPSGLLFIRGQQVTTVQWNEIDKICRNRPVLGNPIAKWAHNITGEASTYTLFLRKNTHIELNAYLKGIGELGAQIEKHTLPLLLPPARQILLQAGSLSFGNFTIAEDGVLFDQLLVPWRDIAIVNEEGSYFSFNSRSGPVMLDPWNAPCHNGHVALRLMADHHATQTKQQQLMHI